MCLEDLTEATNTRNRRGRRTAAAGAALSADQQVFRYTFATDPSSHDFNKDLYCGGESMLFAGLTTLSADYEPLPYAAESWAVSDDGLMYTFKLHPEGRWTNGDPVTAQDFVWSFTRLLNPETGASYASILYDVQGAQAWNTGEGGSAEELGLKAIDDYTLEITLAGPREYFPLLVGYAAALPSHRATVEAHGDSWTEADKIVGNGPFKLVTWERNKVLEFERNEDFAIAEKPKLTKLIASVIDNNAGLLPYESGELDYRENRGIPAAEIARLQEDPQLRQEFYRVPQSATAFLSPEITKPPFDLLPVRQALQHAIDRQTILNVIYQLGQPAYTLLSPDMPYAISDTEYPEFQSAYAYDPELARSLLVGTPYEGGQNWPEITLTLRPVGPTIDLVGEVLQQQLAENLGMRVNVENPGDGRVYINTLFEGKYQLPLYVWFMDYPDPSNFYTAVWYGKANRRRFAWKSDQFDTLVEAAAGETDKAARAGYYLEAERLMLQEAAYIPLYYAFAVNMFKPYMSGIPTNKDGLIVTDNNIYRTMKGSLFLTENPSV
ncbi:MAG: peptide ABC transporter substrate-binding protein [Oscillochloris sp.]|nr:peptide ABC transporter substrate-binding protein [Oscillochloris sp.]